ncbi:MAG: hypothetical protein WBO92_03060 [Candidatus Moraniibacteriota bacterium]
MALLDAFRGLFREVSVLEILNLFQMGSVKGLLSKVGFGGKGSPASNTGDAIAEEGGKGNIDEHNALIALAEVHFGKSLKEMQAEDYSVSRTRFSKLMAIHRALREQNKPHGSEKLMHIIGHESHLHGTAATAKASKGQKPDGEPPRIEIHDVRDRTNPAGKLIIRFLTDIQPQDAVDLLTDTTIVNTRMDTTTATARAAKDNAAKVWGRLCEWYGEHDTEIHVAAATYLLRDYKIGEGSDARPAIEVLLGSDEALEWIQRIDAAEATPVQQRELQEGMQKWLQEKVLAIRQRKGALRNQERQRNSDGRTDEERSQRQWRWIYIVGSIAIAAVLTMGGIQAIMK